MLFIISILFVLILSVLLHKQIKKHANVFNFITILISISFIILPQMKLDAYIPEVIDKYFISIFSRGAVSTAAFTLVMYAGALNRRLSITKTLMSIRAELSIMACILTLGHNILFGMIFFPKLFLDPGSMQPLKLIATILTLIMICIMLPLMITSFTSVRKRMSYKNWKNLQRLSYLFYGLIYVHIACLFIPKIQKGKFLDITIYTVIFLAYAVLRIYKYSVDTKKKQNTKIKLHA
ncbi:ferric reductase-like transmembrane domain-containing protein [Clostridium cylindrosporum]|uniref:Ferric oxidoreductase domain-containing protein n=1 Tax=Clostridium cylindrosporum DSM 605 TaxID=1121307 RepID=A0A0J8D6V6_CLOCY|nr:ferric reductase-like transmembrane domain-containing protein [Clostridium cylindrosporum]KMT21810.1 hypothetical protein CLCY_3c00770 [Clostridium cylindrosporum DSM 605]